MKRLFRKDKADLIWAAALTLAAVLAALVSVRLGQEGHRKPSGDLRVEPAPPSTLPPPAPTAPDPGPPPAGMDNIFYLALQEENLDLERKNQALQHQLDDVLQWILDHYQGKIPVEAASVSKLNLQGVDMDYRLDAEVANLLNVSEEEELLVNDALAFGRNGLLDILRSEVRVDRVNPDQIVLEIPPYPERGKALREDLHAALKAALGEDRFQRFLDVTQDGMNQSYEYFGEGLHSLSFEWSQPENGARPQLRIRDGWLLQEESGRIKMMATEETYGDWPEPYRNWLEWMPEDFM